MAIVPLPRSTLRYALAGDSVGRRRPRDRDPFRRCRRQSCLAAPSPRIHCVVSLEKYIVRSCVGCLEPSVQSLLPKRHRHLVPVRLKPREVSPAVSGLTAGGALSSGFPPSGGSSPFPSRFSTKMNRLHALQNASGVFVLPMPYTWSPCSRSRLANRAKSLAVETSTNPSNRPVCILRGAAGSRPTRLAASFTARLILAVPLFVATVVGHDSNCRWRPAPWRGDDDDRTLD